MGFRNVDFAALVLAFAPAGSAFAATTQQSTPAGPYELVVEVRTADPGEAPIMHVATEWTRLHLRWRSADRRLILNLADDGYIMALDLDGYDCGSRTAYLTYGKRSGAPQLRRMLRWSLDNLVKVCPRVPAPLRAAYRAEYANAERDFPAAMEAMKRKAIELYNGRLERCLPPKVPGIAGFGGPACDKTG